MMKAIINHSKTSYWILSVLIVLGFASCKKENSGSAPSITRVRTVSHSVTSTTVPTYTTYVPDTNKTTGVITFKPVTTPGFVTTTILPFDSTTTVGKLNTQYAIVGSGLATTLSVSFNGVSVFFNPALVTDNTIIITIPTTVPFSSSSTSNKLVVVTKYGSVSFGFTIQQPAPTITSFTPLAASTGDVVTITGTVFNAVTSVMFDNTVAQIVGTPTPTQIQVKVPAGIVQAYIYVVTPGGTAKSTASYGFKSVIYDDKLQNNWGNYTGYSSVLNFTDTSHPKRGTSDIAVQFADQYGALQIGYGGNKIDVVSQGLTAIKFSIYGGAGIPAGQLAHVVINGDYGNAFNITLTPGAYTDYTIPLSKLGNPTTITEFVIQALGTPVPSTIYVDDIGFI